MPKITDVTVARAIGWTHPPAAERTWDYWTRPGDLAPFRKEELPRYTISLDAIAPEIKNRGDECMTFCINFIMGSSGAGAEFLLSAEAWSTALLAWLKKKPLKVLLLLALLVAGRAHAGANIITSATGIQEDKQIHFAVGYITADVVGTLGQKIELPAWQRRSLALLTVVLIASAKEGMDSITPKNKWDWQDWAATVGGAGVNITLHW